MNKKLFFLLVCFHTVFLSDSFAKPRTSSAHFEEETDQCVFLGPRPSFIIKQKNQSSSFSTQGLLKTNILNQLSTPNFKFSSAKPMSGGAYIASFPPQATKQIKPGCYSKEAVQLLVDRIKANGEVEYVMPNLGLFPSSAAKNTVVNLPIDPIQWNLLSPPAGINTQDAWGVTRGNPNAVIAVLDVGQLPNKAFDSNVLDGFHFNNIGSFGKSALPGCARQGTSIPGCWSDDHGTHVAGIVGASGVLAYGKNIYGVAPRSSILPINVFSMEDNHGADYITVYISDIVNALNWLAGEKFPDLPAAPSGLVGINMSLGGAGGEWVCEGPVQLALNRLMSKNISVAVAAGNANTGAGIVVPASCQGVITVAAVGQTGLRASYSNYGPAVKIAAPGGDRDSREQEIYSTGNEEYVYIEGTSMASPHVAGLFALLYSVDPTLTPAKVLSILQETATPFPVSQDPEKNCKGIKSCGAGIINALAAVHKAKDQAATLSWNTVPQISIMNQNQATISWGAAQWQPERTTPVVYTVNLNGSDVQSCKNISSTTCNLSQLQPTQSHTIFIKATDERNIYSPIQTPTVSFSTFVVVPPILSSAVRNPLWKSQAWVNYSQLGSSRADCTYTVNGLSNKARISLDANKNRFVISEAGNGKANIGVIIRCGSQSATSNFVGLPSY